MTIWFDNDDDDFNDDLELIYNSDNLKRIWYEQRKINRAW